MSFEATREICGCYRSNGGPCRKQSRASAVVPWP